eukprot:Pgem_evm1s19557
MLIFSFLIKNPYNKLQTTATTPYAQQHTATPYSQPVPYGQLPTVTQPLYSHQPPYGQIPAATHHSYGQPPTAAHPPYGQPATPPQGFHQSSYTQPPLGSPGSSPAFGGSNAAYPPGYNTVQPPSSPGFNPGQWASAPPTMGA